MTTVADETSGFTVIVLSCYCCLISKVKSGYLFLISVIGACRLWVIGIAVSMDAPPISYKNRLMHIYIINTTLLVMCLSDMFRLSKGHPQGERLIHFHRNVSVVLPEDGPLRVEICRSDTVLIKWC